MLVHLRLNKHIEFQFYKVFMINIIFFPKKNLKNYFRILIFINLHFIINKRLKRFLFFLKNYLNC